MTKILFLSHKGTEAYSQYMLSYSISSTPKFKDLATTVTASRTRSELYYSPRRSLRQKGMCPEGRGFPYYSPSKSRLTSQSCEVESSQKAGDISAASINDTRDTDESSNEERTEDDTVSSAPTFSNKGGATSANDGSQSETGPSQGRNLTNRNVRRQIIRPREDPHAAGHNGVGSPPESFLDSTMSVQSPRGTLGGTNSVRTAAEALVAMATPTKGSLRDSEEEAMAVESDGNSNRASRSPPNGRRRNGRSVSLVLDDVCNGGSSSSSSNSSRQAQVSVDGRGLLELFERIVKGTDSCSVEEMERIHTTYKQLVFRHRMSWQREDLLEVSCCCDLFLVDVAFLCAGSKANYRPVLAGIGKIKHYITNTPAIIPDSDFISQLKLK